MDVRAAAAGVSAAAVHLSHEFATIRQRHQRLRAKRRATVQVNARMSGPLTQRRAGVRRQWQQQVQTEKCADVRRNVVEKERWLPLVAECKIQTPIAIYVCNRNGPRDHRFGETDFGTDVVVTSIGGAHEECIQILAAQVRTRLKAWPKTRVVNNAAVARAERLQFGPPVDFALDEAHGLNRL